MTWGSTDSEVGAIPSARQYPRPGRYEELLRLLDARIALGICWAWMGRLFSMSPLESDWSMMKVAAEAYWRISKIDIGVAQPQGWSEDTEMVSLKANQTGQVSVGRRVSLQDEVRRRHAADG